MKNIKTFYEVKQYYSGTAIEEIQITEVEIKDGELWFSGTDKDGYEIFFNDRCIGVDFFINFEDAEEVYNKIVDKKEKKNED